MAQELGAVERPEERSSPLLDMAMTDAVLGYNERAKDELQLAQGMSVGASNPRRAQTILGIINSNGNAIPPAHASSRPSPPEKGLGPLESKFIAAMNVLGDLRFNEAIRGLRFITEKDDDPLYAFLLGVAYLRTGDWQRAMESMRYVQEAKGRILTPQSELPVVAWPLSFYYAGICNEKLGHRAEAVTSYRRFLDIWRGADPDLRQVADTEKRLARSSDLKSSLH